MRKKGLLLQLLLLAATTLLFTACKKNSDLGQQPATSKELQIAKVKLWLEGQKTTNKQTSDEDINLLNSNLDYSRLKSESLDNNENAIIVPIVHSYPLVSYKEKKPLNSLVLFLNASGEVKSGNIIQYMADDGENTQLPKNAFNNIVNTARMDKDGLVAFLGLNGKLKYQLHYKNGSFYSEGIAKQIEDSSSRMATCYNTYLVTTYYHEDGTVTETRQFLYSSCPETWQEMQPGDSGGGEDIYEYAVSRAVRWEVARNPDGYWRAMSFESVTGKKVSSEPEGGHFTGINHQSSYLDYGNGFSIKEIGNTVGLSNSNRLATSDVTVQVTWDYTGAFTTASNRLQASFQTLFP